MARAKSSACSGRLTQRGLHGRQGGDDLLCRERYADNAGRGGKDLVEDAAEAFGGSLAGAQAAVDAGLTSGAVGVAGVYEHGGDAPAGRRQVATTNGDRRGDDLVLGKHHGRVGPARGVGDGEVEVTAGLDAGLDRSPLKAAGECGGLLLLLAHDAHTLLKFGLWDVRSGRPIRRRRGWSGPRRC